MPSTPSAPGTFVARLFRRSAFTGELVDAAVRHAGHLADPHAAMRAIRHARKRLPLLLKMEKMVMRTEPEPAAAA